MADMKITLEVVGPNRGKTFTFRNYDFIKGRITIQGQIEAVMGSMLYLERTMQAYPVGSEELARAIESIHGNDEVHSSTGGGDSKPVQTGGEEISQPREAEKAAELPRNPGPQAGTKGMVPGGSGRGRPQNPNPNVNPVVQNPK